MKTYELFKRLRAILTIPLLCLARFAPAQDRPSVKFEIASVKPAGPAHDGPAAYQLGPGTADPEHIRLERQSMLRLLGLAYGLDWSQISGPAWVGSEYYAVEARVPPATTKEQVKLMWQDLLAERFHLRVHFAKKEFPVYELSATRDGPKLVKSGDVPAPPVPGFPVVAVGSHRATASAPPRTVRQTFRSFSWIEFTQLLGWVVAPLDQGWSGYFSLGKIVDKTGLDGLYDFTFEFAGRLQSGAYMPPLPDGELDTASPFFDALRQQLGLKLEEKKAMLDVLVVDHADRVPTEN